VNESRKRIQAHFLMMLGVLLWANAFIGIKLGLRELSFLSLTTLRFFFAALFFIPILILSERKFPLPTRQELPMLILLAFLGGALYHVALNFGEQSVTAGTASLLIGSSPIFTAILASLFLKDRLGWLGALGIVLAFGGLFLISWKGTGGGLDFHDLQGVLAVLTATLAWSGYPILARNLVLRRGPIFVSAYMFIFGLLMMLPFNDGAFVALGRLSLQGWGAVLFLSLFCTVLGYIFYNRSLQILGATTTIAYIYLIPVTAIFFGWLILGEQIHWLLVAGAMMVIMGVVAINLRGRRRAH
jgi:drug/metabolite transporter (DMT)-like permease